MNKTYIIAEIGINHNGNIEIAKKLIDIAAAAGCDAIKFQKRNPDVSVPEDQKNKIRSTPWGEMTYLNYKKRMEFDAKQYDELAKHCISRNIDWSVSVWDLDSLEFIKNFDVPFIKIPSAKLNDKDLVFKTARYCENTKKKLIISVGMSTWQEIYLAEETASGILGAQLPKDQLIIMYCKSSYPAPLEDLNLSCIPILKQRFPKSIIGYSGHEFKIGTTVNSVALGAEYIERHITLDRAMWGTDQMASVEPDGLFKLVSGVRDLEKAFGDGQLRITELEKPIREKLRGN